MNVIIWLISKNLPLHQWREQLRLKEEKENQARREGKSYRPMFDGYCRKDPEEIARIITNSCSNGEAVELIVREWDSLPSEVRKLTMFEMNEALGTRSNNKTKGILRVNERLGGQILRSQDDGPTERQLITVGGKVIATERKLNVLALAAEGAHAAYALPSNYDELTPSEKRKVREELAKKRRESKQ